MDLGVGCLLQECPEDQHLWIEGEQTELRFQGRNKSDCQAGCHAGCHQSRLTDALGALESEGNLGMVPSVFIFMHQSLILTPNPWSVGKISSQCINLHQIFNAFLSSQRSLSWTLKPIPGCTALHSSPYSWGLCRSGLLFQHHSGIQGIPLYRGFWFTVLSYIGYSVFLCSVPSSFLVYSVILVEHIFQSHPQKAE